MLQLTFVTFSSLRCSSQGLRHSRETALVKATNDITSCSLPCYPSPHTDLHPSERSFSSCFLCYGASCDQTSPSYCSHWNAAHVAANRWRNFITKRSKKSARRPPVCSPVCSCVSFCVFVTAHKCVSSTWLLVLIVVSDDSRV